MIRFQEKKGTEERTKTLWFSTFQSVELRTVNTGTIRDEIIEKLSGKVRWLLFNRFRAKEEEMGAIL